MRAPAVSPARPLGRLALTFVALMLATASMTTFAKADEPSDAGTDGEAAVVAGVVGGIGPEAAGESADGASGAGDRAALAAGSEPAEVPTLAGYLSAGMLRVSADVPLMGDDEAIEPVVGSFTVDGLTYAIVDEGQVALVAASPRTLAGGLVGGSDVGSDAEGAGEPAVLALSDTVSYDGSQYSLTTIAPRALAGCTVDTVIIPASVATVDQAAFEGSPVASIEVADGNPDLASYDGMLFDADRTRLLLVPEGKQGAARIPKEAEVVDPSCFSHSAGVDSIDVEAGSAAYSSRNGCLYDAAGEALLWAPFDSAGVSTGDGDDRLAASSTVESANDELLVHTDEAAAAAAGTVTVTVDLAGGNALMRSRVVNVDASGNTTKGPFTAYDTKQENFSVTFNGVTTYAQTFTSYWENYPHYQINWIYNTAGATLPRTQHDYHASIGKQGYYLHHITFLPLGSSTGTELYTHFGSDTSGGGSLPLSRSGTLTCHWQPYDYDLKYYDSDGTTSINPSWNTTYRISDSSRRLPVPAKNGYRFDGWKISYASNVVTTDRTWRDECPWGNGVMWLPGDEGNEAQWLITGTASHIKAIAQWTEVTVTLEASGGGFEIHRQWIPTPGKPDTTGRRSGWYNDETYTWDSERPSSTVRRRTVWVTGRCSDPKLFHRSDYTAMEYSVYDDYGRYLYRVYPLRPGYDSAAWSQKGIPLNNTAGKDYHVAEPGATYKAGYSAHEYKITYHLGSGTVNGTNPTTYKITDDDKILLNPTYPGWDFTGWRASGASGTGVQTTTLSNGQPQATIQRGTYGDLDLYTDWQQRNCTFDVSPGAAIVERHRVDSDGQTVGYEKREEGGTWAPQNYETRTLYLGPTTFYCVIDANRYEDGSKDVDYMTATRLGYKVTGWLDNDQPAEKTGVWANNDWHSLKTGHTYKPVWRSIAYTVQYKTSWDGGAYSTRQHLYRDEDDPDYGVNDYTHELTEFMREHEGGPWYTFMGWSTDPNDDTADYAFEQEQPNLSTTDGDEVTLYVAKQKNEATFDPAGGALLTHRQDDPDATIAVDDGPVTVAWTGDTLVSGSEPRVTYDCTYEQGDDRRCIDAVRAGYAFAGWEVVDRTGNGMGEEWRDEPIARGATYRAKWVPALRVDVPLAVDMDLTVDWGKDSVVLGRPGEEGPGYVVGELASYSAEEVRVAAVGQEVGAVATYRANALAVLAGGDEVKAANLGKARLTLSADRDGAPQLSVPLTELYANPDGSHPGSMANPQDVTGLGLVVPAAASAEQPGVLGVRYGMDCEGLPLGDVALDARARPVLKLVYLVGLAGS